MTDTPTTGRARRDPFDPDALAALEEQRDFLLRSLDDLEREHAAGDVDHDDYVTLRDDYTHRAAVVIRAIEERHVARAEARAARRTPTRTILGVAGVAVFALLAGLGVARAAGDRSEGESITGGVLETVGQRLFACQQLAAQGEVRDALVCYDEIIEENPANVEAVTYRAWTLVIFAGMPDLAWPHLERAVALDPAYPDARAFRAILLLSWCRPDEALAELDAFDAARPLAEMRALVYDQYLVAQRAEELRDVRDAEPAVAGPPTPIGESEESAWDQCPVLADGGVLERIVPDSTVPEATG
jgi:tetratricopeptide (TPR) repeat protein